MKPLNDMMNSSNYTQIVQSPTFVSSGSLLDLRADTPYNGLYGEAPPERGTFLTLQVYERVGISRIELYERVKK